MRRVIKINGSTTIGPVTEGLFNRPADLGWDCRLNRWLRSFLRILFPFLNVFLAGITKLAVSAFFLSKK